MPKSTKSSAQGTRPVPPSEEDLSNPQGELSSSEHEADPEVCFHPSNPCNYPQVKGDSHNQQQGCTCPI